MPISRLSALCLFALATSGCAGARRTATLEAAPDSLAAWTVALRDSQPEEAYAAVYAKGDRLLVFIAAMHAVEEQSLTFMVIGDAYRAFDFDSVIVEGFLASEGYDAPNMIEFARQSEAADGFQPGGEAVPAILGALDEKSALLGGEPDDADIRDRLLADDFKREDILGFYVLRSIPQWIRERRIADANDAELRPLIESELANSRRRLDFGPDVLATFADWSKWYEATNKKRMGDRFAVEETGPLADGPYGSNKIAAAISLARDGFLHELIIQELNRSRSVLAIFGGSHYLIHRPALECAVGAPCYIGPSPADARSECAAANASARPEG